MVASKYFDEKRYSYHVLASHVTWAVDYEQADPTTAFEIQIQQQYAAAYDSFKQGQFAKALDAFQQLENLILTLVHPTLPINSYWSPAFIAPMDVSLIDVLAAKSATVLLAQPIAKFNFPSTVAGQVAALSSEVESKLAPFETTGLSIPAQQIQLAASINRALAAAAGNNWQGATAAYNTALRAAPDTSPGLRAALTHDLAISIEKSGGPTTNAIDTAQSAAQLFGVANLFSAQFDALQTLAGMQLRANDAAGSQRTLAAATSLQSQQRLFQVALGASSQSQSGVAVTAPSATAVPRLISTQFLGTLPAERAYTVLGTQTSVSMSPAGDGVANMRSYLQTIAASTDVSLLLGAACVADGTQIVAYLPSMYFFVIPMAIGDCLAGLGNLEEAATTYASVLVYPYINEAFEIPKLWSKLASVYIAMGDRDYRNAADDVTKYPTARTDYEHIIKTDDTLDATSPVWADARFGGIKARVAAFAAAGFLASFADNPEMLWKVMEARLRLQQIKAGLDFFGLAVDYLPPFSWEYLQNTAKYFAQQASQMEQRYIQFTAAGEDETLQRRQLDQQAAIAAQTVVLEQRGLDEANASVDVANAGLNYAKSQQTNANVALQNFQDNRDPLAEYDEIEAWANAAAVGQGSEVRQTVSGFTYYNTSGERRSQVIQDLETAREKISQDMEQASLSGNVATATDSVTQAQKQVDVANAQVAIANQRIALAQLQQADAEENRDYLDMKEFNARLWFDLAANARKISQRYTDMATAVALLAQRAYNAETGRNLKVIRGDYTHSATDNLMGADFLSLDLDTFTYDYVTTTKTKKAPVKRIISLADSFPYSFNQLKTAGKCMFQTTLAMFDRQTPGMYLCKIRNVELVFVGITRANVAGSLRNVGASRFRQADGTVVTRLYPADVMPLSAYELRQDALAFRVDPNDLQVFENNGVDTFWLIDMPLSANDIDFASIIDVQLVLYYDGFFDPSLEATIAAGLPKSSAATRVTSMQLTFPDELFYLKSQGQAQLVYEATLFPATEQNLKRTKSSLRVTGNSVTQNGLTLRVASTAAGRTFTVKTDVNGIVAGSAAADQLFGLNGLPVFDTLAVTIAAADNPGLVAGGKLNLSGLTDLLTYFEYTFDYR